MLLKTLLIAMFFAVRINRSFEAPELIDCVCAEDCLKKVKKHNLHVGIVPILVTKNVDLNEDQNILNFFNDTTEVKKILRVNVAVGRNGETVRYLHRKGRISYPFVSAMVDNQLIRKLAHGYNVDALEDVLNEAKNPERNYVNKYKYFTSDLRHRIDQNNEKKAGLKQDQIAESSESNESDEVLIMPNLRIEKAVSWYSILHDQPKEIMGQIKKNKRKRSSPSPPLPPSMPQELKKRNDKGKEIS